MPSRPGEAIVHEMGGWGWGWGGQLSLCAQFGHQTMGTRLPLPFILDSRRAVHPAPSTREAGWDAKHITNHAAPIYTVYFTDTATPRRYALCTSLTRQHHAAVTAPCQGILGQCMSHIQHTGACSMIQVTDPVTPYAEMTPSKLPPGSVSNPGRLASFPVPSGEYMGIIPTVLPTGSCPKSQAQSMMTLAAM